MRETINLTKTAEWEGVQVLNMTAEVSSDPNSQMNYMISVLNNELYTSNIEYFRKEVQEFKQIVHERENYLFGFYYPEEVVEEPIGEPIEDPIEEPIEDPIEEPIGEPNSEDGEPEPNEPE